MKTKERMKKISGKEALERMRMLRTEKDLCFTLLHLTYTQTKQTSKGIKKVEKCRLRAAMPEEVFETDSDHYLTYYNIKEDKHGTCFKKLIRFVAFPPNFETLKIDWFNEQ